MDHDIKEIQQELLEHVGQILTAIVMKSRSLEQHLSHDLPQEAQMAREIHELAKHLIISNRHLAHRLTTNLLPNEIE